MSNKVSFHNHNVVHSFKNIRKIKSELIKIFSDEGFLLNKVNYIFCTDDYLLHLNVQFLAHDTFTDILTFALSQPGEPIEAEIYISLARVKENASVYGTAFKIELLRVIIHGILHLCGYNDHTARDITTMRAKENFYLAGFNFAT